MQGSPVLRVRTGDIACLWIIIYGDVNSQVTCRDPWVLHWTVKDTSEEWLQMKGIWSNSCASHFFFLSYWFLDIMFSNVSPQNSKILKMLQGSCKYLPTFKSLWSFKIQLDLGIETLLVHSPCSSWYFAFSSPFYIPFLTLKLTSVISFFTLHSQYPED